MPFSIRYGQTLVCSMMLLFLLAQVCPQLCKPLARSTKHIVPTCCTTASNATIREPVNACFEQKETTFSHCHIHAYILTSKNNAWCVDPRAWWLKHRLQKLENRGIRCQML